MSSVKKSSKNTGPTSGVGETCEPSRPKEIGELMSSAGEIPARPTAQPVSPHSRASAVSSSALLRHFAQALWSEKIQVSSETTLLGPGGNSELAWNRLVTLCCPSDSEPVALGLSIDGTDCSCSPQFPTPTATDWKGGHDRHPQWKQWNLRDWWRHSTGRRYLPIPVLTAVQGFPAMWTGLEPSETV